MALCVSLPRAAGRCGLQWGNLMLGSKTLTKRLSTVADFRSLIVCYEIKLASKNLPADVKRHTWRFYFIHSAVEL